MDIELCTEIEYMPETMEGLARAFRGDSGEEGIADLAKAVAEEQFARICGRPVVPGTAACERHTNEEIPDPKRAEVVIMDAVEGPLCVCRECVRHDDIIEGNIPQTDELMQGDYRADTDFELVLLRKTNCERCGGSI